MSEFKITSITNRDGSHGPQICGIVTFTGSGLTLPNGTLAGPRGRGVFGGGYSPGGSPYAVVNTIDYVTIATLGNALDFGDLTQARSNLGATASSTRGVFLGGKITPLGSDYYQSTIDFIEIQSTGNAFDFGDLNDSLGRPAAAADNTRAVFAGGYNNSLAPLFHPVGDLQYITISTKGNTSSFGNQFFGRYSMGAAASPTRALYFGGGLGHPSVTNLNIIDFVTIATLGDAQDYGDLTEQARMGASCSNSVRGLRAAGLAPSRVNTIDFVNMASTGDAVNFGDLSYVSHFPMACSSSSRGLFAGGYTNPASANNIEKVEIATTANATDFGDLTRQGGHGCGVSDAHGGIAQ
tara:strand:+ start:564 stop:1619 length:1056 start_codon:yes stop_codon:yes gene_type:complete